MKQRVMLRVAFFEPGYCKESFLWPFDKQHTQMFNAFAQME